jgi:hypothetical protein
MAKENEMKNLAAQVVIAASGTDAANIPPGAANPALDLLTQLLLKRIGKEEQEDEAKRQQELAMRKQGAMDMAAAAELTRYNQENCAHKKQNGSTLVVGIRDSRNNYNWACQRCAKSWINYEVPPELRPDLETVGGPINVHFTAPAIPKTVPENRPEPPSVEGY